MKCINCKSKNVYVKDSRYVEKDHQIKRRRQCLNCNYKFLTKEMYIPKKMYVIKKSLKRELFDKTKIHSSIEVVSKNRDAILNHLEKIVDSVCFYFEKKYVRPINSDEIARYTMSIIKKYDDVAYIRFASVYFKFVSLDSFIKFLQNEYSILN